MSKIEDIKWSRQSYALKDVLRKYTFPQIVKVTAGIYSHQENESLAKGQVLRIHQLCRQTRVLASDRKGNHISIPIRYGNARFEIINNGKKSKPMYLREVIDRSLLPREVRFAVEDEPRFRLQFINTISMEEKFNSLLLKTMYEESFIQGNAINQNLLDTMVLNIPVHAKLEVVVAENFRDSPVGNWDKYTNLLERLVNKHVTFKLHSGNNQITFFSDKRLEKNSTQKDLESVTPAAVLYIETNMKRKPPTTSSPTSKTVGHSRTRSKSVDQLADEKPRSVGARGSKTYVNAFQRQEHMKKAVSTGDILKDGGSKQKNHRNTKGDGGSGMGSFSSWLLGTLTGRKKKKRPTVIEGRQNTAGNNQTITNGDNSKTSPRTSQSTPTQKNNTTPTVQNGRGRKATKTSDKSTEQRSKSQPARQKQAAGKKRGNGRSKSPPSKVKDEASSKSKNGSVSEIAKNKESQSSEANTTDKAESNRISTIAPSVTESQQIAALKRTTDETTATNTKEKSHKDSSQQTSGKDAQSSRQKQPPTGKDNQTGRKPPTRRDSITSLPKSILKKVGTPSISSFSSTSSGDGRMEMRNDAPVGIQTDILTDLRKNNSPENTEFYATLRQNMPVDIPVPDYKQLEQQRAMSIYATTPRSQRFNQKKAEPSSPMHPNQHIVGAIVHNYPEDETDYMNAEVETYPHHIYMNSSSSNVGQMPPSPPPPAGFRDQSQVPPPPAVFNNVQTSSRSAFLRSESEQPQNKFASQLARLKPISQTPRPKPPNQTGDLMEELREATVRRKSRSDLDIDLNPSMNFSPRINGFSPRRESDPFNDRRTYHNGGTLPVTKRQHSSPALSYTTPRSGPLTKPKPRSFGNNNGSCGDLRTMNEVPRILKGINVSQISDCMRLLNLEKYIDTFKTHKIDGEMLGELNKEMLKSDLGMSEIDAAKILKFATGWRPL